MATTDGTSRPAKALEEEVKQVFDKYDKDESGGLDVSVLFVSPFHELTFICVYSGLNSARWSQRTSRDSRCHLSSKWSSSNEWSKIEGKRREERTRMLVVAV